jgi:hypothetical protein
VNPREEHLAPAHSLMRSSQPRHNPGSDARHTPKTMHMLGRHGTPPRPEQAQWRTPDTEPVQVAGPTLALPPPQDIPVRYSHVLAQTQGNVGVTSATLPSTQGAPIPAGARNVPREGQRLQAPANHRQAIHHPATAHELMHRNRERG